MQFFIHTIWVKRLLWAAAFLLCLLYLLGLSSDRIGGLFGIMSDDEGAYILSAKHAVLFGQSHFFADDRWKPELIAPLLHRFALLTIDGAAADPLYRLRFCMALCVLVGTFIIAWIVSKYHKNSLHGIACFISILLNPVLFFYARTGLSEGLQYTLLTLIIALFFALYHTHHAKRAALFSALAGALIALLFIAKISAAPACISLCIGGILAMLYHPSLTHKPAVIMSGLLATCITLGLYFGMMPADQLSEWWRVNITDQMMNRAPLDVASALAIAWVRLPDIAYYLTLMPIFALYFITLPLGAQKNHGFIRLITIITISIILLESFFGGEIRRNFFGMTMLSITFSIVCVDYLQNGLRLHLHKNKIAWATLGIVVLHVWGVAYLLYGSIKLNEPRFIIACIIFLMIAGALVVAAKPERIRLRRMLMLLLAGSALAPMLYQSLFAPYTRRNAEVAIDQIVGTDGIIIGHSAPYFFPGLKSRTVLTNCTARSWIALYANAIDHLPLLDRIHYLGAPESLAQDECRPADYQRYYHQNVFAIIDPINFGGPRSVSERIVTTYRFSLYEKR